MQEENDNMNIRGYAHLFSIIAFAFAVGLACNGGAAAPTLTPVPPTQPSVPTEIPGGSSSGDFVTFTDKNDYYQIQVPADWTYETSSGEYGYVDTFTSLDGQAMIENIMHDEGTSFAQKYKGQYALYLLHTYYSSTGKEGDIRISDDSIQKDGSERLVWTSKGGGKSGISFFEVRNGSTFLMFTVQYVNEAEDQYLDLLNGVIASYAVP